LKAGSVLIMFIAGLAGYKTVGDRVHIGGIELTLVF